MCILCSTAINIFGLICKACTLRITGRPQTFEATPSTAIPLQCSARHATYQHRPSSTPLLTSSSLSSTPSPEDALYTSCLQALPPPARTSRLPSVARAQQQGPGQECDANAEGAVVRPSWRARRDGGTRVASSRASLPGSAGAKRRWKRAKGIARTVVGGMRGGHRSQPGALLHALFELRPGRPLEMGWGPGAVGVRIEVDVDGLARGWARARVGRAMSQRG